MNGMGGDEGTAGMISMWMACLLLGLIEKTEND